MKKTPKMLVTDILTELTPIAATIITGTDTMDTATMGTGTTGMDTMVTGTTVTTETMVTTRTIFRPHIGTALTTTVGTAAHQDQQLPWMSLSSSLWSLPLSSPPSLNTSITKTIT